METNVRSGSRPTCCINLEQPSLTLPSHAAYWEVASSAQGTMRRHLRRPPLHPWRLPEMLELARWAPSRHARNTHRASSRSRNHSDIPQDGSPAGAVGTADDGTGKHRCLWLML